MCLCRLVMDSSDLRDTGRAPSRLPTSHRPVQWSPPTRWRSPLFVLEGRSREAGRSLECMKASPGGTFSKAWRREMRGCRDKKLGWWGGAKKGECKVNGFTAAVIIRLDGNGLVQSWWDAGKWFEASFRLRCIQMCLFLLHSETFLCWTWKRWVSRRK